MRAAVREHATRFVKFAMVGGSGVLVNLAVFNLTLLAWGGSHHHAPHAAEYLANGLGFVVAVVSNYYLNRRWTFRSEGRVTTEFPKFFAVSVAAYALNLVVYYLVRHQAGLTPNASQLVAIASVMPFNYLANTLWSFR